MVTRWSRPRFFLKANSWPTVMQFVLLLANLQALGWMFLHYTTNNQHDDAPSRTMTGNTEREWTIIDGKNAIGGGTFVQRDQPLRPWLPEAWARSPAPKTDPLVAAVRNLLSEDEQTELTRMCGRTLYHGLENVVVSHNIGTWSFFATGDLPLMWIRDSAFQIGVLLPRLAKRPGLRPLIEGALRAQAFYITQDPYANGFYPDWRDPAAHNEEDRLLGRGGWVGVRNYELDSGAYYLNLLYNYWATPGLYRPENLLQEPLVFDAAMSMVDTWIVEQNHTAGTSPYRFVELPNDGLGTPVGYTGMIWSGFRPSDDANTYGYSIPSNMYAAGALRRALELNNAVWRDATFKARASKLLIDVETGIRKWGIAMAPSGSAAKIYAYEVDGLGNQLLDFDDPNWPSLVSIPLLGWQGYDHTTYQATRTRLLSKINQYWFEGQHFRGMGSPHTEYGMAWALGTLSEALTATDPEERAEKLRLMLKLQCGDGLMHESINVDVPARCTRRWFEWANSLAATAVEQLTGEDCDLAAETWHRRRIAARELNAAGDQTPDANMEAKLAAYPAHFHQSLEAMVQWDVKYESRVESWKGIGWHI